MNRLIVSFAVVAVILLQYTSIVFAGSLDDYYLQQFRETKSTQLQKAVLSVSGAIQESARCGMPIKHGLRRDWNLLEASTQKTLSKQLASPALSGNEQTLLSPSGRFKIHYSLTGADAAPSIAWVQTVAQTFDDVASSYAAREWQLAPTNGNLPYNVYLRDLAPDGFYGVTNSDIAADSKNYPNSFTSWMEVDNNFTDSIYRQTLYTPLQSLQITAAHEYHHAIQYGYNYYFDIWYAEATSTFMEDELYDSVNQLYSYIPNWFTQSTLSLDISESTSTGGGYGRWIFNRYLEEKYSQAMLLAVWEKFGEFDSPDGISDIYMIPVLESLLSSPPYNSSLSNDFFGFAKRVYTRDWASHTAEIDQIHPYAPVATYSAYPVYDHIALPHYSFAYYKFVPTTFTYLTITITKSSGIKTAMFKNGSELTAESNGTSYSVNGLRNSDEVVLLIANTTGVDNQIANFSSDGTVTSVTEPNNPPEPSTTPITTTKSNSINGCFIATAAYGSYLHPQVQLLRNFRDDYLLTNAPGRAFVALYYHFSPPLADFIARHTVLCALTRLALTPLVMLITHPLLAITALFSFVLFLLVLQRRTKKDPLALEA